jgi:hypothetical protein
MKKLKRNYIQTSRELRSLLADVTKSETYKIQQINILVPKFMKLQNTLMDLGINVNRINYNIK